VLGAGGEAAAVSRVSDARQLAGGGRGVRERRRRRAAAAVLARSRAARGRGDGVDFSQGVAGIRDPPRAEAAEAIARCERAGIRIILITGDSRETAVAIAQELGILDARLGARAAQRAFQGTAFFKDPSPEAARARADALKPSAGNAVFYRTAPEDKQRIVKLLHDAHRDVTAMTGDGVNDAPALQQASIGIAMGTGTEVAKEASDMVLMDDDFASIVAAVEEGRTIYKNMQAFVCFLLSCNFGEVFCVAGAALAGIPDVLSPLQLLWVNLVTDGPPATAIGFNPPDPEALNQPPRRVSDPVLTPWLLTRYAVTGAYVGFATVKVFLDDYAKHGVKFSRLANWATCDPSVKPWKKFHPLVASSNVLFNDNCALAFADHSPLKANAQTMALSTLVAMELLKALGAVSLDHSLLRVPFWENRYLCVGVAFPFALHLTLLYTPLRSLFGLTALTFSDWLTVVAYALPILLVDEALKAAGRLIHDSQAATDRKKKLQQALRPPPPPSSSS